MPDQITPTEKLAYSIKGAAEAASLSVPYIRNLIKEQKLKAKTVGRRVLILKTDMDAFLNDQPDWKSHEENN